MAKNPHTYALRLREPPPTNAEGPRETSRASPQPPPLAAVDTASQAREQFHPYYQVPNPGDIRSKVTQ